MDNENEKKETEVRDPAGLLAAYNKLKEEIRSLSTERDELKSQVEAFNSDEFRIKALTAEAKLALQNQGIKDVDRLMPYVGTDGLEFGEDGSIVGLDERMEKLRKDLPEIFDPKVRSGGKADIFANDAAEIKTDPLRQQVHAALTRS